MCLVTQVLNKQVADDPPTSCGTSTAGLQAVTVTVTVSGQDFKPDIPAILHKCSCGNILTQVWSSNQLGPYRLAFFDL